MRSLALVAGLTASLFISAVGWTQEDPNTQKLQKYLAQNYYSASQTDKTLKAYHEFQEYVQATYLNDEMKRDLLVKVIDTFDRDRDPTLYRDWDYFGSLIGWEVGKDAQWHQEMGTLGGLDSKKIPIGAEAIKFIASWNRVRLRRPVGQGFEEFQPTDFVAAKMAWRLLGLLPPSDRYHVLPAFARNESDPDLREFFRHYQKSQP